MDTMGAMNNVYSTVSCRCVTQSEGSPAIPEKTPLFMKEVGFVLLCSHSASLPTNVEDPDTVNQ